MTASKAKTLSNLFKTGWKKAAKGSSSSLLDGEKALKQYVSKLDISSSSTSASSSKRRPKNNSKSRPDVTLSNLLHKPTSPFEDSFTNMAQDISSILCDNSQDSKESTKYGSSKGKALFVQWLPKFPNNIASTRQKEVSRERKQKWVLKISHVNRFNRLIKTCGDVLGTEATMDVFDKLGRETGVKEYNAIIAICLEKARTTDDEEIALENISMAFKTFNKMREQGFLVEEETYGPFLKYFIEMGMVEEFQFFCGSIKDGNQNLLPRLGYYEMLLWIEVDNEEKIQELCSYIAADSGEDDFKFKDNYLLALCERGRKEDLLQILENIDTTRISSVNQVAVIFKSLGRFSLDTFAEKFLLAFKTSGHRTEDISELIFLYASSIPNLAVEDIFLKLKSLHLKFKIAPTTTTYEKIIIHCCDLRKVHVALKIVDEMCEVGLRLSIETLHRILYAAEESYEYNLVQRIYSVICVHNLKPNCETFRIMISMAAKMKDFEGAYAMLNDLKKMNLAPTASIYNAIMMGYYREKNVTAALRVLKQMEQNEVKPDSQTFCYMISNCNSEEDIAKYYETMKSSGISLTKHVFMALINAYGACGQFEKAKQVLLDKEIPVKSLNEIKSALVQALAYGGLIPDALEIYEEIKQVRGTVEPKAVISLIEHFDSEEESSTLLQLLKELHDPDYWVDGCCRTVLHCVKFRDLRSVVDLLKQLSDKFHNDELTMEGIFDEIFSMIGERGSKDLQFGLTLVQAIKDELGFTPSRRSLDFLLSACVNSKDLQSTLLIQKEYQLAGLPCNVLSSLWIYQALLACGDRKSARAVLHEIPKDDPHVRCIIKACKSTYAQSASCKEKKQKKKQQREGNEI